MPDINRTHCYFCEDRLQLNNEGELEFERVVLADGHYARACPSCYQLSFVCHVCGEITDYNDEEYGNCYHDDNGQNICNNCFDSDFTTCYECSDVIRRDGIRIHGNRTYCVNHDPANAIRSHESSQSDQTGEVYSMDLPQRESRIVRDVPNMAEFRNASPDGNGVLHYYYKPNYEFYCLGNESRPLFLGTEMEIEGGHMSNFKPLDECVVGIHSIIVPGYSHPFLYCKHDGSLGTYGIEIVSMPFSLKWYRVNRWAFNSAFNLNEQGYVSDDLNRCGMHVHLSKDSFCTTHLYKFLSFFYDPKNSSFIYSISNRRSKDLLYKWASPQESSSHSRIDRAMTKSNEGDNRRTAVNLTNHKTVEIRIFQGTLIRETFERNIETCVAIYDFTKDEPLGNVKGKRVIHGMDYRRFIGFVGNNSRRYPSLYTWCRKKL